MLEKSVFLREIKQSSVKVQQVHICFRLLNAFTFESSVFHEQKAFIPSHSHKSISLKGIVPEM
jgi:hypothetical protein